MQILGDELKHAVITDAARAGYGDMAAFYHAVDEVREEFEAVVCRRGEGEGIKCHLVLTVESPERDQEHSN